MSTIEAMACGVPAVAADVPGMADILRDSRGGMLVPADDPAAAADLVAALLGDPARRAEMAVHGRAEVEQFYCPAVLEERVLAFYADLLP